MNTPWLVELGAAGALVARASHLLVCLDFDGTLAPLVDDPAGAVLPVHVGRLVQALSEHPRVSVAIVSGRERVDLQTRVGIPGLVYAGNHGLEISGPGFVFIEPTALASCDQLKELTADLAARLQTVPGAVVENKGLTLTVHHRRVPSEQWEDLRRIVHAGLAQTSYPFLLTTGSQSYEVRPRVPWHKGTAVEWIRDRLGLRHALIVYVGDDQTDEDAFGRVRDGITVKVGLEGETAAQYRLPGSAQVPTFLEWLSARLETRHFRLGRMIKRSAEATGKH